MKKKTNSFTKKFKIPDFDETLAWVLGKYSTNRKNVKAGKKRSLKEKILIEILK